MADTLLHVCDVNMCQSFSEHPVLERDLGDHLLQHPLLASQLLDLVAGDFSNCISGRLPLPRLQEVFAPAVVEVRSDFFTAEQLRDALLTSKTLEHDPNPLLGGELPTSSAPDPPHGCFAGLFLPVRNVETLRGVVDPVKYLLAKGL
jgi:hypothetical protein